MGRRVVVDGQVIMGSEEEEQVMLFLWAQYNQARVPELELLHHIPNGGKRNIGTAKKLKAQGVKAGVPDIFLPVARNNYHGLYIELKVGNNKTSEQQEKWLNELAVQGYKTEVCYGSKAAIKVIQDYLGIKE